MNAAAAQRKLARAAAASLCADCPVGNKRPATRGLRCDECAERQADWQRERNERRIAAEIDAESWTVIDPAHVMRGLRKAADLTMEQAAVALGMPPTPGSVSTVTSGELRGAGVQLAKILDRAEAYGLEIQIRVRPRRQEGS